MSVFTTHPTPHYPKLLYEFIQINMVSSDFELLYLFYSQTCMLTDIHNSILLLLCSPTVLIKELETYNRYSNLLLSRRNVPKPSSRCLKFQMVLNPIYTVFFSFSLEGSTYRFFLHCQCYYSYIPVPLLSKIRET